MPALPTQAVPPSFRQYILVSNFTFELVDAWATATSALPLLLLDHCHIISLHHRKDKRMPGHEFLLAHIAISNSIGEVQTRYIRVERRAGVLSSTIDKLFARRKLAEDMICISALPFDTTMSNLLYDLRFPETNRPTILHFAAMLVAISSLDSHYGLYRSNCYWFAGTVFDGMAREFNAVQLVTPGEQPRLRGMFVNFVPIVNRHGIPSFGISSTVRNYLNYQEAVSHVRADAVGALDNIELQASNMNQLVQTLYARHRTHLYARASQADGVPVVVDDARVNYPLYCILAVLCYVSAVVVLGLVPKVV